jgi:hypothetical protein
VRREERRGEKGRRLLSHELPDEAEDKFHLLVHNVSPTDVNQSNTELLGNRHCVVTVLHFLEDRRRSFVHSDNPGGGG